MAGWFGEHAEGVGRADEARAEVPLPHTVDDNSGSERVGVGGDPVCKFAAAAAVCYRRLRIAGKEGGQAARHDRSEPCVAASDMEGHILDLWEEPSRGTALLRGLCQRRLRQQLPLEAIARLG